MMPLVRLILRRMVIIAFAFVLCGGLGAFFFYTWAGGKALSTRSYNRPARRWVESLDYAEFKVMLRRAFLVGGAIGGLGVVVLIGKSDTNDTDFSE